MSSQVTIALVQMGCGSDPEENLRRAVRKIRLGASRGAQLVCLQELFRSPYFCQKEDTAFFDLAETVPGTSTEALGQLAQELEIVIIASLFERRAAGLYHNTAVVIDADGALTGKYRKMHIPDDPLYYEKFYFTPGDLGFRSHETRYGKVGVLVCWDQWFPEAARLTALEGAQILFYPTAIGWLKGESKKTNRVQHAAWETIQRGHAIGNGVFLAVANRVGVEGSLRFWGQSFVSDPFGELLAKASAHQEEVLVVRCDLSRIEEIRRDWPFLRDRRIESYQGLTQRFGDRKSGNE